MKIILSIFSISLFALSVYFGLKLLNSNQLSGSEFIALIISFAIIGLIIAFSSEVQEFSIAGNIVKLKEVKKDAQNSIQELKSARTETFRFLLSLSKRYPGGLGDSSTIDSRVKDFWNLHSSIVQFNGEKELKKDILEVLDILLKGQINSIAHKSDDIGTKYRKIEIYPTPNQLTIESLDEESVEKSAKRNVCNGDVTIIKNELLVGLDEYRKLFELYNQLKSTEVT